jgi:DNA-binding MarR family transcriptional regulator
MSRIGYLLSRPTLEFQRLAQAALEPLGLIPPHMGVLSTLHFEGPQTQRALGVLLKVDPTTMVWLIDGLEKKRLVRRGEHPKDRRAHLVGLSSAGQAAFRRAAQALNHVEDEFLAPLSKKERDDLKRLLAKLFRSVPMQGIPSRYFVKKA